MERVYCRGKKKNRTVGIRADGNTEIGLGHLMRCLSLALALRKKDIPVIFITAEEDGGEILSEAGFKQVVLHSDYRNMLPECDKLEKILEEYDVGLLIVDSYRAKPEYFRRVRSRVPVVRFEEEPEEEYPADGVINYNIYAGELPYDRYYGRKVRRYLGSRYAPVRPEFRGPAVPVREKVEKILILMGGSDQYNISGALLERIAGFYADRFSGVRFETVSGIFNPNREKLEQLARNNTGISVRFGVEDMASLMRQCDLAIAAAGSTMYELSALGIPTVCCYYVKNQKKIAEGFSRVTGVMNAGNYTEMPEKIMDLMIGEILKLMENRDLRKAVAASMRKVTDGMGAERLAEGLQSDFLMERDINE